MNSKKTHAQSSTYANILISVEGFEIKNTKGYSTNYIDNEPTAHILFRDFPCIIHRLTSLRIVVGSSKVHTNINNKHNINAHFEYSHAPHRNCSF
jgi:hypothetical protein